MSLLECVRANGVEPISTLATDIVRWVLKLRAEPRQLELPGFDQVAVLVPLVGAYTERSAERTGKGTDFGIA